MEFANFIVSQLQRAGISALEARVIYHKYKLLYFQAFTHKSFSGKYNYEMLEAYGDSVLNSCLFDILHKKFPSLNQKSMTWAFHRAKSEEILYKEGEKSGFFEFIRMGEAYKADVLNWRDNSAKSDFTAKDDKNLYIKILEDVVESFCGALVQSVNLHSGCFMGPGMECLYRWAIPIVQTLPFNPLNVEETQNVKMQVKEFWDVVYAKQVTETDYRNNNYKMFPKDKEKSRPGQVWVHICDPLTKTLLGCAYGYNESNAQLEAATKILPILKTKYEKEYFEGQQYLQQRNATL